MFISFTVKNQIIYNKYGSSIYGIGVQYSGVNHDSNFELQFLSVSPFVHIFQGSQVHESTLWHSVH